MKTIRRPGFAGSSHAVDRRGEVTNSARLQRSSASLRTFNTDAMRENADEAARLLRMLANGQRLRVLCLLVDEELCVGQINERIALSQSALSQHLAKLREEGLVTTRRESQTIYYKLSSGPAQRLICSLHDIYCGGVEEKNGRRK